MTKSEIHRMLRNPIYTGDFVWCGKRRKGSHEPLVTHDTFEQVQAILSGKPRRGATKRQHAFMGLLTCARCGCAMTAEMKKGKYVGCLRQHVHPSGTALTAPGSDDSVHPGA